MKYFVTYRGGEISAEIDANSPEEAWQKFLDGDCEFKVNTYLMHLDLIEVERE